MKILRQREIASLENFTVKKKKKKLISRLWKSRPRRTNFRVSFRRGFEAAVERSSGGVGSAFESLPLSMQPSQPPSLPPQQRCAFPYPDDRGPVSSPSCSGAWWEDERGDRDPLAQIPHTSFFLHLKYHKTGETRW